MKSYLLVFISCIGTVYNFYEVPENQPRMYFDGEEWRAVKSERNTTSSLGRPTLSILLDMFTTTPTISKTTSETPFYLNLTATTKTFELIDLDKWDIATDSTFEKIFGYITNKKERTTTTEKSNILNEVKDFSHFTEYFTKLSRLINNTEIPNNETKEILPNTTLVMYSTEWIRIMTDLSNKLGKLIDMPKLQVKESDPKKITKNNLTCTKEDETDLGESRRTIGEIDDLLNLFTDGIEIDNGSDSSDELGNSNRKFIKAIASPKLNKGKVRLDTQENKNIDTDSADIVSDGAEETRLVLVEDKSVERNV